MSETIQSKIKGIELKTGIPSRKPVLLRTRNNFNKRFATVLVTMIGLSFLSNPIFINSQQPEFCNFSEGDKKKPKPTASQLCSCERIQGKVASTYEISDSAFGIKPVRKTSKSRRAGVASTRGAVEWTQRTKLLGKLEIPNTDDSNSPEVAALREQLRKNREERRQNIRDSWEKFSKRKLFRVIPCDPPATNCPGKLVVDSTDRKDKTLHFYARQFNQYYDLQNTDEWHRLDKFDWRERGLDVGQVMNQGECGSCWAFASVSVYQSAWELEKLRTGSGVMAFLEPDEYSLERLPSVQQLLNCMSREKGDCIDGWHGSAFAFMVNNHVPHIPDRMVFDSMVFAKQNKAAIEEYTGRKSICTSPFLNRTVPRGGSHIVPYAMIGSLANPKLVTDSETEMTAADRALAWGYVNDPFDEMPSVEKLKAALIEHGPLAVSIWTDNCFSVYKSGVFNGRNNRSVNHVVVLIGWDDSKKAWLIKNSWGEDWGEKGFGWVEYGSNNIGLFAAWIQPSPVNKDIYKK